MRKLQKSVLQAVALIMLVIALTVTAASSGQPLRIVSLAPSITEVLFALGLGERIVGVTNFCDYPAEAKQKQKVGGMSNPSLEAVISLKPDLVIVTTNGNIKDFEERLRSLGIRTHIFRAQKISDYPREVRTLGALVGSEEKSEELSRTVEEALTRLKNSSASRVKGTQPLKTLFIVWPEPLIVAGRGSIANEALSLLGTHNIAGETATEYPKYSIEEILRQSPDVIFIGKGHKDMASVSQALLTRLRNVPAVKNGRVHFVGDGLYRLGPRTLDGVSEIAAFMDQR